MLKFILLVLLGVFHHGYAEDCTSNDIKQIQFDCDPISKQRKVVRYLDSSSWWVSNLSNFSAALEICNFSYWAFQLIFKSNSIHVHVKVYRGQISSLILCSTGTFVKKHLILPVVKRVVHWNDASLSFENQRAHHLLSRFLSRSTLW